MKNMIFRSHRHNFGFNTEAIKQMQRLFHGQSQSHHKKDNCGVLPKYIIFFCYVYFQ